MPAKHATGRLPRKIAGRRLAHDGRRRHALPGSFFAKEHRGRRFAFLLSNTKAKRELGLLSRPLIESVRLAQSIRDRAKKIAKGLLLLPFLRALLCLLRALLGTLF